MVRTCDPLSAMVKPNPLPASLPNSVLGTDFDALMRRALDTRSYADVVAVLPVAEWLYGDWAARAGEPESWPPTAKHSERIRLHNNPQYNNWVNLLREEFDAVEPAEAVIRAKGVATSKEAVRLERPLFDSAMAAR